MSEKTTFNFEQSVADLEALVAKMANEDLSLEASLQCFENGVALTKQCQQALQQAEQKIDVISNQLSAQNDG